MDEFDAKHEIIQKLLDMLKGNAVGEVESHLHPKMAVMEKVSEKPDMPMEHMDMPEMHDEPMEEKHDMPSEMPSDKKDEKDDMDDEDNSSAFGMFRKK